MSSILLGSFLLLGFTTVIWSLFITYSTRLRTANIFQKTKVLRSLGLDPRKRQYQLVGFFHPYCNAGGGGERVLWTAITSIQRTEPGLVCVVYSGDVDATKEDIIAKVKARFDITLDPSTLHFVFLKSRRLVEDRTWPYFTLLGQSIGSMILAWEAMSKLIPDLYIDTMGYAFTFHVVSMLGNIAIGAYVHYPTINTDMLNRVKSRKKWHTNSDVISSSSFLSQGKLLYYRFFMYYYSLSLQSASFLMVNSSWTKNHVDSILAHSDPVIDMVHRVFPLLMVVRYLCVHGNRRVESARIVYPCCDTREMEKFGLEGRERVVLSLAQFRPEKDHAMQLRAFRELIKVRYPEYERGEGDGEGGVRLVLIGGCRNDEDKERVEDLRELARGLGIENNVEFIVNASYPVVLDWLARASIGFSTMVDEHFGINVVEFMAAGMIPVAHRSGGPLKDIIVPYNNEPTGYHADTPESFAEAIHQVFSLTTEDDLGMRKRARKWAVKRFSEEEFVRGWDGSGWKGFLPPVQPVLVEE